MRRACTNLNTSMQMPTEDTAASSTKIAVVTGASCGLGRSTVLSLAARGVDSIFTPEVNRRVAEMTALGRAGQPDDIGPMIAALLSADNRWINGQRIEVSGGMAL